MEATEDGQLLAESFHLYNRVGNQDIAISSQTLQLKISSAHDVSTGRYCSNMRQFLRNASTFKKSQITCTNYKPFKVDDYKIETSNTK